MKTSDNAPTGERITFDELRGIFADFATQDPAKQARTIEMLLWHLFHMSREIDTLRDFIRDNAGQETPRPRVATMREFEMFRDVIVDPPKEPYLLADPYTVKGAAQSLAKSRGA